MCKLFFIMNLNELGGQLNVMLNYVKQFFIACIFVIKRGVMYDDKWIKFDF